MNDVQLIGAMQHTLYYIVIAVCMMTIPILLVGIVLSILQAATQINEMTLTFIPKFLLMFFLVFMLSPWMMNKLVLITRGFLLNLPNYIR